jgi:hypothetical protein
MGTNVVTAAYWVNTGIFQLKKKKAGLKKV